MSSEARGAIYLHDRLYCSGFYYVYYYPQIRSRHRKTVKRKQTSSQMGREDGRTHQACRPSTGWTAPRKNTTTLCAEMVESGTFIKLNQDLWPGCYYARSDASDVARVEDRTFICSLSKDNAGPTNNWENPFEMRKKLKELFNGCMRGRTMYVLPFSMGPVGSPMSQIGVQLTDSPYVVVNMRIMARIGLPVYRGNRQGREARGAVHAQRRRCRWRPATATFRGPAIRKSTSFTSPKRARSGPTAPATAATRCWARSASRCASPPTSRAMKAGWRSTCSSSAWRDPQGEKTYVAAAFPSACGKTNFAMLIPPRGFDGWKVWTVGDDIAWIKPDANGRLRAINPEAGFFGVAPGTSNKTNPNAMATLARNTIFTNVALTPEGGVWWEGMTDEPPAECLDWKGNVWTPANRQGNRRQGRASQLPLHRARLAVPDHRSGLGRSRRRADQRAHLRRPPRHHHAAGLSGVQLERGRLHRRHHGFGNDGRGRRHRRQGSPRSHGHAAVLRLSHGRLLPALDQDAALARARRRASSTSTGSARTRTASSSGPASAKTCAC